MLKGLMFLAALVFAGGYFAGAFGGGGYSRTVGRPQAEVMAALEDLDITAQPGAPGSTAAAAGGIKPVFRLERAADHMTWYVMSGERVATMMTATFSPTDGGKGTLVKASVTRGDAPDDNVSPAFRSRGLTMGLFGMALEGELDKLTAPPAADAATCQRLLDRMTDGNLAATPQERPGSLSQAMGGTAKTIMRLNAEQQQLRQAGCPTNDDGAFRPVESQMAPAEPSIDSQDSGNVSFEPGKPMIDVSQQ